MHEAAGGRRTEARKHRKDGDEDRSACGAQQAAGQGRPSSHTAPHLQQSCFPCRAPRQGGCLSAPPTPAAVATAPTCHPHARERSASLLLARSAAAGAKDCFLQASQCAQAGPPCEQVKLRGTRLLLLHEGTARTRQVMTNAGMLRLTSPRKVRSASLVPSVTLPAP